MTLLCWWRDVAAAVRAEQMVGFNALRGARRGGRALPATATARATSVRREDIEFVSADGGSSNRRSCYVCDIWDPFLLREVGLSVRGGVGQDVPAGMHGRHAGVLGCEEV